MWSITWFSDNDIRALIKQRPTFHECALSASHCINGFMHIITQLSSISAFKENILTLTLQRRPSNPVINHKGSIARLLEYELSFPHLLSFVYENLYIDLAVVDICFC